MARLEQPRRKHEPVASATLTAATRHAHLCVASAALPHYLGHRRRGLEIGSWTSDATQGPNRHWNIAPPGPSAPDGNRHRVGKLTSRAPFLVTASACASASLP
jgi:hypothetical protein